MFRRLTSIRGQLVVWYLAVLAVTLLVLGIFQSITLADYLRSTSAFALRHSAYRELSILGPCYVRSPAQLDQNALTLARLLGGQDTAVTIITGSGQTLATHGIGPAGNAQPLRLSASTVRDLIGGAGSAGGEPAAALRVSSCPKPGLATHTTTQVHRGSIPEWARSLVSAGNLLLVAVKLGPPGQVLGFAILGRPLTDANATVARTILVFGAGAVVALLLAALVALPIINRALRPLRRVAETAKAIAEGRLEERAHLARSPDEIGRLGQAFDAMVDRLQAAVSTAAASEDQMRRFLADASHELRTPVTVLRGASQVLLLQGAAERPEHRAALQDMHAEAVRLGRLIDDLLTLSRLDAHVPAPSEYVDVRSYVADFSSRYARIWPDRVLEIEARGISGALAQIDPEILRRIVTNLVDNSARYSRAGGWIRIVVEPSAEIITLAVADEGPGMSEEDAARIFDRFYRTNKSRSRDTGGNGLGLSIVAGLVEQSGGSIAIDTGPQSGTTITVTLPSRARLSEVALSEREAG